MKESSMETIYAQVQETLVSNDWLSRDFVQEESLVNAVVAIYMNNDTAKSVTTHGNSSATIIARRKAISVILNGHSSRYQSDMPICDYYDLSADIMRIFEFIDIALLRIEL